MKTKELLTLIGLLLISITLVPAVMAQTPSMHPSCNGASATIFVDGGNIWTWDGASYTVVGPYAGELAGAGENDVIVLPPTSDYSGPQTAKGGPGNDTICGSDGDDNILGGIGNDTIYGGDGNDTIHANQGTDTIYGEGGDDFLHGGMHGDSIWGGPGNDSIIGFTGADTIYGEDGDDYIFAGVGDDELNGGAGIDNCDLGDNDPDFPTEHYECEALAAPLATALSSLSAGDGNTTLPGLTLILLLGFSVFALAVYRLRKFER